MPRNNSSPNETPSRTRSRAAIRSSSVPQSTSEPGDAADRAAVAEAVSTSPRPYTPSFDEIAEAAYHRYLQRGGGDGQDFDDWLEAERELKSRQAS